MPMPGYIDDSGVRVSRFMCGACGRTCFTTLDVDCKSYGLECDRCGQLVGIAVDEWDAQRLLDEAKLFCEKGFATR